MLRSAGGYYVYICIFDFRLILIQPGLILNFLCLLALLIHESGLENKEIDNQPWLNQN